ncbi:family A G protein-coupled receptor-like protein [Pseudovirgaria hyperparasitica]|uniref:Family A G protein-coupled receptor-like protein n=1 Tax=Pseudovirgaria hyperparasitica TaxID=470096 RepID=A0A6A6VYR1_9PEZI|nr:family A G protein-coupled receptor-like protein [Pseudovirgaria hyperparasitica]KAF2755413.1 family A G protein-coupled receptor-like protein [Pseudovirgaria hyperparasitica]
MIVDPVEALKKTSLLLVPTTTLPIPTSLPTVDPFKPDIQVAHHDGQVTLWVVFVIMLIASAVFAGMSWTVPLNKRLYHVITTLITIIAALSYFAMASGHGVAIHHIKVRVEHEHAPDTFKYIDRQVFWARYVDWSLTTPLLLLDLAFLAGLSGGHILMTVVADLIMILTGLFAAFGAEDTPQKWGWYTIACIAYLVIIWHLVVNGRALAAARGGAVGKFYSSIAGFTILIWTAYPIVWGIADGARNVSVDGEIIAYAVLDVLAKPIFGLWLLITHAKLAETNVDLSGTFWSNGLSSEGRLRLDDEDGA